LNLEDGLTKKQKEALDVVSSGAHNILLYGGARSGKTFFTCLVIVYLAAKYDGSRHLIARLRYAHARNSIWLDTLKNVIEYMGLSAAVKWNETDHYVKIGNSEIWVDGLDDRDRVDKILGREYATIYLNEVSQIPWQTVTTVMTRLAQKIEGFRNKAFYDCNPPSKHHWSYKLFILGEDPETGEKVKNRKHYACLRLNPGDNRENLPDGYIEEVLEPLPDDKRRRFLLGEYGDSAGAVFTDWDVIERIPDDVKSHSRRSMGLDFGFSVDPAALVDVYVNGDDIYLDELIYEKDLTNQQLATKIKALKIEREGIQADSAEPKSIKELQIAGVRVSGAEKGPDSVRAGIDWLRSHKIHITQRSANLITEFQEYVWSQNRDGNFEPKPIDDYNHGIDAVRYSVDPIRRRSVPQISAVVRR
jgi:phage terminase large subunit